MRAVFVREFNAYFISPTGYIYLAVYCMFAGIYFFGTALVMNTADLRGVFSSIFTITMFLIPVLTMRLISEDLRLKTDQLLLTVPVRLSALVLGKFMAVLAVFALGVSITLVYGAVLSVLAPVDWAALLCNYLGLILVGSAVISIGMFISSLTESQIIAAIGGFAASMALMLLDVFAGVVPVQLAKNIMVGLSFSVHYTDFTLGILNPANIVFFLSACVVFLFLTQQTLDRKRWK